MTKKLELLAPAGSLETLKAVVLAGADAVYFGGEKFGARAYAKNLTKEDILFAIDFGHLHGRKMFLAVNTLLKDKEQKEELYEYLLPFYERGLDAVIVQDFGAMQFIRRNFKGLPVHASTQMTVTGAKGAAFLTRMGASRIVLARELSLNEIQAIREEVPTELECFVHGALCYSYSGQCLFSSILGGRSGNRGRCAQPCRLSYEAYDADFKKISGKEHGYLLSPKDLCAIALIPKLAESGVFSFKIEGRMKQTEYARGVVSVYRRYMDRYLDYGAPNYVVAKEDEKKLFDFGNRCGFTKGYASQKNGPDMITFQKPGHEKKQNVPEESECDLRESICGRLEMRNETPVRLSVSFQDETVVVTGDVPDLAKSKPLTKDMLRARLEKTKNTPFVFQNLEIEADDGLFLPASSVNDLRRRALDALEEQYFERYKRKRNLHAPLLAGGDVQYERKPFFLSASAETTKQADVLLQSPILSRIYLNAAAFSRERLSSRFMEISKRAKEKNKQVFCMLPAIFRSHTAAFYQTVLPKLQADGFLVRSYDALEFLLGQKIDPKQIRADDSLYAWSRESQAAFAALGLEGDTVPLELSRKEIRNRANAGSEMHIYGRIPLMISAQCIQNNLSGCSHISDVQYIKDRYGIYFPVKNYCSECYNVIYNSRPLHLFSVKEELQSLGAGSFRFSFTIESARQTQEILEQYEHQTSFEMEHTCGHYKRGVE